MLVVTRTTKRAVYHKEGHWIRDAIAQDWISECGMLWYYRESTGCTIVLDRAEAEAEGKRPCINCFPDLYTRRDVTFNRGPGFETYTRDLAWQ